MPAGIAPIVAVPTTAGTGSEVGRAAVVTDPSDHTKKIIFHPLMLPKVVIADPELTIGLPPKITAWTGMDALSHCLEAYCSPFFHPLGEGIALEGMRLVKEWLPVAVRDGRNIEARAFMLAASSMGAVAFQKGLGAMHSMSHPCSSLRGTHHGLTNAVVMPYVLAYNAPVIGERLAALARYLDLPKARAPRVSSSGYSTLRQADRHPAHAEGDRGRRGHDRARRAPMAENDPSTGRQSAAGDGARLRGALPQGDPRRDAGMMPLEAVKAYHAALKDKSIATVRSIEDDCAVTEAVLKDGVSA